MTRFIGAAVAVFTFAITCAITAPTAMAATQQVAPSGLATNVASPTGWYFYNDETDVLDNALGSFVSGPATAPQGTGSAQISVTGTQRRNLATNQFAGTALGDITALRFDTYNPSAGNGFGPNAIRVPPLQRRLRRPRRQHAGRAASSSSQRPTVTQRAGTNGTRSATEPRSGVTPARTGRCPSRCGDEHDVGAEPHQAAFPSRADPPPLRPLSVRVGEPYADGYTENIDTFTFGTARPTTSRRKRLARQRATSTARRVTTRSAATRPRARRRRSRRRSTRCWLAARCRSRPGPTTRTSPRTRRT